MKLLAIVFCMIASVSLTAQQIILKGKVSDKLTVQPLAYANIRIAGTLSGTTATINGFFELRLAKGNYNLVVSSIGYISDTVSISLSSNKTVEILLSPTPVNLPEITVFPGENPAIEILRRAIEAKHDRDYKLNSYVFRAYTKGLVRSVNDITSTGRSVSIGVGTNSNKNDSAKLKISGIIENESIGYFKKPDNYKEEIIARKQSANTSSTMNLFTGGRLIQNFYSEDVSFLNRKLPSPISDNALNYYYFIIEDTLAMDKQTVFKINFEPINRVDPGFVGTIYIADKNYNLVKIETGLNDPANPGKIFKKINIIQQFTPIKDKIVMPIDYRISVEGNPLGLFKFGAEMNSIFYNYQINDELNSDFFDMTAIKVKSDADKKDSTYWLSTQTIPNTDEEIIAYKRIDSVEAVTKGFAENFSLLSSSIAINKNLSVTGPLALYSFNRVEGHTLNFGFNSYDLLDKRLNLRSDFSYGFNDEKFKIDFGGNYYLGEYRTSNITFRAYSRLSDLFTESIRYNKFTSSLTSLITKYDFRDYYYTKGFSVGFWTQAFPVLGLGIGFFNRTDNSAVVNTDFSLLQRDKVYLPIQPINETRISAITANFQLDFRKYFEDGYYRRRINFGEAYWGINGGVTISSSEIFKSNLDYQTYRIQLNGNFPTFASARMNLTITSQFSKGNVPYQMLFALPGNIEGIGQSYTFRTLKTGEIFGDRAIVLSLEHNFTDEIFRFLHLNFLIDWQMNLTGHFNAGFIENSSDSKSILPLDRNGNPLQVEEFRTPFAEIGFGIGQVLFPFKLEFTWKLNHLNKNNIVFGLNIPLL